MAGAEIIPRQVAAPGFSLQPPPTNNGLAMAGEAITNFADAWQKGQDQTALVKARLNYSTQIDDLHQQFLHDPDPGTAPARFAKAAQDAAQPYFDGFNSQEARDAFTLDAGQMAESRRISIMDTSFKREGDIAVANVDALGDKAARDAAFAPNPAVRQSAIESYNRSLMGVADAGYMSHEEATKKFDVFTGKLALFDGRSAVEADPKTAKAKLADSNYLPDLDPLARVELQSQADAKIRQREREAKEALAIARANASASLADYDSVIASGLPVSQDLSDQVRADVRASGDPRLALHMQRSTQAAYFADGLRGATPREVEGQLATVSAAAAQHGADSSMAAAVMGGRKFLDRMNSALGQDPLSWSAQQGVVAIAPLQLNGQDAPAAWQGRIRAAQLTAQHYGTEPRYFTGAESQQLKEQLSNHADPKSRLLTLQILTQGLGSRAVPELQRLGAPPALVTAGGLLAAGPAHARTAFDIVNGETALAATAKGGDGQSILRPTDTARALSTSGGGLLFGGVRLPQGMPQVMQATSMLPGESARISAAADAYYAAHAPQAGLTGKDAATTGHDLYQRGLQLAAGARFEGDTQMGGITQYRGRPVVAPAIVAADAFEGVVSHLTSDDLTHASVTGKAPAGPVDIRKTYLVTVGDGRYVLSTTDPTLGAITPVPDKSGAPYRLDFPKALTILQARAAAGAK